MLLLPGASNSATILDSFNVGGSSISTTISKVSGPETGLSLSGVANGKRTTFISGSTGGLISVTVNNAATLGQAIFTSAGTTSAFFGVDYGAVSGVNIDLSAGNQIDVSVIDASKAASLEVWLRSPGFSNSQFSTTLPIGASEFLIPFSSFTNVNFGSIEIARVLIVAPNGGRFALGSVISSVPEPSCSILMLGGLGGLLLRRRR